MNHWPECIDIDREHPSAEKVQICSNEAPWVMYGPSKWLKL